MELPLHPMIVHMPMALSALVPLLAAAVLLAWTRGWLAARAWWLVVALQVVLVGSAALSLQSGEEEEERVEHVVAEAAIEAHEEAAQRFTALAAVVLALAIAGGVFSGRRLGRGLAAAAALGSLAVAGQGVAVGHAGGELVWIEGAGSVQVRDAAGAAPAPAPAAGAAPRGERGDDE